jgi:hypothetical protein
MPEPQTRGSFQFNVSERMPGIFNEGSRSPAPFDFSFFGCHPGMVCDDCRVDSKMAQRASLQADAAVFSMPPHCFQQCQLRSKRKEDQTRCRTAFLVGFTNAERRVGQEVAACHGEARDLQECVDGRGGGLLHLPAARI